MFVEMKVTQRNSTRRLPMTGSFPYIWNVYECMHVKHGQRVMASSPLLFSHWLTGRGSPYSLQYQVRTVKCRCCKFECSCVTTERV